MRINSKFFAVIMAGIAGSLMAIQGTLNSILAKTIGLLEGTFTVHLIGTVSAGILVLFWGNGHFNKAGEVPWFAWLGGLIGVGIIIGVAISIPRLGVGMATTSIIAAQLLTAYLIDHFGLFGTHPIPFNYLKLCGIILIVAGSRLLMN